jgi:hypothetical protein
MSDHSDLYGIIPLRGKLIYVAIASLVIFDVNRPFVLLV